jgi:hypothetical protein
VRLFDDVELSFVFDVGSQPGALRSQRARLPSHKRRVQSLLKAD